jgi:hypothetical protein
VGSKIGKTTEIFDEVKHLKNQGASYWAERKEPLAIQIIKSLKKQLAAFYS